MMLLVTRFALFTFKKKLLIYVNCLATEHKISVQYIILWLTNHALHTFVNTFIQILNFRIFKF